MKRSKTFYEVDAEIREIEARNPSDPRLQKLRELKWSLA